MRCNRGSGTRRLTELVEHPPDAPVVGSEVVSPVGDAVHLVDHHHPGTLLEHRHHLRGELGVGEAFGGHEDQVERVGVERVGELVDRGPCRRVDGHAAQAESGGRFDLVAHQREERRDQKGRTEPLLSEQMRGEEVDRALAPSGALDDEDAVVFDQCLDRLALVTTKRGIVTTRERAQGADEIVVVVVYATAGCHSGPESSRPARWLLDALRAGSRASCSVPSRHVHRRRAVDDPRYGPAIHRAADHPDRRQSSSFGDGPPYDLCAKLFSTFGWIRWPGRFAMTIAFETSVEAAIAAGEDPVREAPRSGRRVPTRRRR